MSEENQYLLWPKLKPSKEDVPRLRRLSKKYRNHQGIGAYSIRCKIARDYLLAKKGTY